MSKAPAAKATSTARSTAKKSATQKQTDSPNGSTRGTSSARKGSSATSSAKKTAKKASAKKTPVKKTAGKKAPATKKSAEKAPAKKAPATRKSAKKTPAKQTSAKKTSAKKTTTKKAAAKTAPAKKTSAKKTTAKKSPAKKPAAGKPTRAKAARLAVRADEKPWSPEELREVRDSLSGEADRLRAEIQDTELEIADLFRDGGEGAGHDQADVGSTTFERDHEMSLANHSRETLTQIEHALERIDDGTYGICENCGNPVGKLRLMAFPRATLCVSCKQRQERR